jgi:hypothetical protein
VWLKVGAAALSTPLRVPHNPARDRYEIEIWGCSDGDLRSHLDTKGRAAFDAGLLVARGDLLQGDPSDFARERIGDRDVLTIAPGSAMHPVLPLHVELAWGDTSGTIWDSQGGANHHFEFAMLVRGFDHFLRVGVSQGPHGGPGALEYRNLLSNYGQYAARPELGRKLARWNCDAFGHKPPSWDVEPFLALQYVDLHLL